MKTQEKDTQTPFEKFEALARKVMTTPKPEIDTKAKDGDEPKEPEQKPKSSQ